eukprot:CAMPEP_0172549498 /NCGR_PEP_ID=MMETSP1067-20121228/18566_1 /TAXON_ID=265564 ORGANISM="Thalassiosira punctigera, Strain Tpunct2005C2" /NCGR_SAMPLE_ID=MMETSP1067 /ASSEMBLY_ACC=CAM_ASM_000444 /LENGTH=404 /DNA_ID=CAMNT_0013336889 /DNA_START=111 /DNA_END=1325 /DNA_ORIENTATION=-
MIRSNPIKSPMQKLSSVKTKIATRGSQLIDSASSAVAQGTHLSNVVASKANARVEEATAKMRSPEKTTPSRGIRDRINKFDTASRGNVEYHNTTPYKDGRNSRGGGTHRHLRSRGREYEASTPERGMPPPCNPSFYEKENAPNREPSDRSLASDDGGLKMPPPTFRRKKDRRESGDAASRPVNPHLHEEEVEMVMGDETRPRRSHSNSAGANSNQSRGTKRSDRRRGKDGRFDVEGTMDIADLNRAAVMPTTSAHSTGRENRKASNGSYGVQPRTKKREHPLIASPLRKHIRGVHDSACSNAKCTVLKDPFPLLPPNCARPLAAVANWDEVESDGMGHLDTLGTVTTGASRSGLSGGRNTKSGRGRAGPGDDGAAEGERGGEEAALDLLTSAAFMFKNSRRNLS